MVADHPTAHGVDPFEPSVGNRSLDPQGQLRASLGDAPAVMPPGFTAVVARAPIHEEETVDLRAGAVDSSRVATILTEPTALDRLRTISRERLVVILDTLARRPDEALSARWIWNRAGGRHEDVETRLDLLAAAGLLAADGDPRCYAMPHGLVDALRRKGIAAWLDHHLADGEREHGPSLAEVEQSTRLRTGVEALLRKVEQRATVARSAAMLGARVRMPEGDVVEVRDVAALLAEVATDLRALLGGAVRRDDDHEPATGFEGAE